MLSGEAGRRWKEAEEIGAALSDVVRFSRPRTIGRFIQFDDITDHVYRTLLQNSKTG
jgi:hypothetical protein